MDVLDKVNESVRHQTPIQHAQAEPIDIDQPWISKPSLFKMLPLAPAFFYDLNMLESRLEVGEFYLRVDDCTSLCLILLFSLVHFQSSLTITAVTAAQTASVPRLVARSGVLVIILTAVLRS